MRMEAVVGAVVAVAVAAAVCASGKPVVPYTYPHYLQCDALWGGNQMGGTDECAACGCRPATVCEQGCAMSCVSMAMAGRGLHIPDSHGGGFISPGTMNAWLGATGGYVCAGGDCNNLELTAPNALSTPAIAVDFVSEAEKPAFAVLKHLIAKGTVAIAHVRNRSHFVLLTGWDDAAAPDAFLVHDPFYNVTTYPYANISDVIMYDVTAA